MSGWNPNHQAAADTWDRTTQQFAHVEKLSADRRELANRAVAIRARDERIAKLEAENARFRSALKICAEDAYQPCCLARAALAGKEEQK